VEGIMRDLCVAGLDLGGTNVRCGLVRAGDRLVCEASQVRRLGTRDLDEVLAIVCGEIRRLDAIPDAVGIAVAGMVDVDHRRVLRAPNLDWTDVPLADRLEAELGVPVAVLNDVNAITWGEYLGLELPGTDHLAAVFFGTGVGGGLVMNRRLVEGARGLAMEIGHVGVDGDPDAPLCGCGRRGCLESYVGGQNFAAWMRTLTLPFPAPSHMGELDAAASAGEPAAQRLISRLAGHTSDVLCSLITLLDPGHLMVGGTVWTGCPAFARQVRASVDDNTRGAVSWLSPRYTIEAGILGAADFALERIRRPDGSSQS